MPPRWFVRCADCCDVAALADRPPAGLTCECGGRLETMGRTTRDGSALHTHTDHRCPCDERCTHARGPKCECSCGGENHGTGITVSVEHYAGVPRLTMPDAARSRRRAEEYRAARAAAMDAMAARHPYGAAVRRDRTPGEYLPPAAYAALVAYRHARSAVASIDKLKSHSGRMRALRKLVPEAFPEPPPRPVLQPMPRPEAAPPGPRTIVRFNSAPTPAPCTAIAPARQQPIQRPPSQLSLF